MSLTLDEIQKLLNVKPVSLIEKRLGKYEPNQMGPLRWFDKEMRCTERRCGSPTYCKVVGIPLCTMHALTRLNEMLA